MGIDMELNINQQTKTTPKTLTQQVFHPGLFNRPRALSLSDISQTNQNKTNNFVPIDQNKGNSLNPNNWQQVPVLRQNKRKRISDSPPKENEIPLQNKFSELEVDPVEQEGKPVKPNKPPPIMLYGIENLTKLTELIEQVLNKNDYTYKIITKKQLRVACANIAAYKKLIEMVREQNLIGHTFTRKDERPYRIVIKDLHPTTPHDAIKEAIEITGNKIKGEIINARYGPMKIPLSTFFVNLEPSPNNLEVKNIKYIYNTAVKIEDPRRKNTIPQCKRCQQYGHTQNNCMRPYRCVKCADSHKTTECPKVDRNTPAKCALCLGDHPANFKGCEVFLEIQKRKLGKRTNTPRTKSETTKQVNITTNDKLRPNEPSSQEITENIEKSNTYDKNNHRQKRIYNSNRQFETYAQAVAQETNINKNDTLEKLLTKQAEKLDLLIQQMSTLMGLLTTIVNKLAK